MSKISLIAAGAAGYVLGTRAGRERYHQIVDQAQRVWSNPKVQKATQDAQDLARERVPVVGEKLAGAMKTQPMPASPGTTEGDSFGQASPAV